MGIKPIWVFDGKPPQFKSFELDKRKERKEIATGIYDQAVLDKDVDMQYKMSSRLVRVSEQQRDEAIMMLDYMGVPTLLAPSEAEAQCVQFVKQGIAVGVGSEDLDCLAFGAKQLFR